MSKPETRMSETRPHRVAAGALGQADHAERHARALRGHGLRFGVDDGIDVIVAIGIERKIRLALFLQNRRKPRIVAPVRFGHDSAFRLARPEGIIDRI